MPARISRWRAVVGRCGIRIYSATDGTSVPDKPGKVAHRYWPEPRGSENFDFCCGLLGTFSLRVAGAEVKLSRKTQALFAFLGTKFPEERGARPIAYLSGQISRTGLPDTGCATASFEIRRALKATAPSLLGSSDTRIWWSRTIEIDLIQFAAATKTDVPAELAAALGL